jgi:hypothetical protein
VPWHLRLVTGVLLQRSLFDPRLTELEFAVYKEALRQNSVRVLRFSPVTLIPPMPVTHHIFSLSQTLQNTKPVTTLLTAVSHKALLQQQTADKNHAPFYAVHVVFSARCPSRTERTDLTTGTGYPLERTSASVQTFLFLFASSCFCESPSTATARCHTDRLAATRAAELSRLLQLCNISYGWLTGWLTRIAGNSELLVRQWCKGKCRY